MQRNPEDQEDDDEQSLALCSSRYHHEPDAKTDTEDTATRDHYDSISRICSFTWNGKGQRDTQAGFC